MGCFGGSTSGQKAIGAEQEAFFKQLTQMTSQMYGRFTDLADRLTGSWKAVLDRGINQLGFDPSEKRAMDTAATEHVADNYTKARTAASNAIAASGGGDSTMPSGAKAELSAQIESAAAGESSDLENKIQQADYATGRQNYLDASGALSGVMSMENPVGFANAATSSGMAAENTQKDIAAADSAWMAPVFGAIGGIASGFASGGFGGFGGGGKSSGVGGWGAI